MQKVKHYISTFTRKLCLFYNDSSLSLELQIKGTRSTQKCLYSSMITVGGKKEESASVQRHQSHMMFTAASVLPERVAGPLAV